MENRVGDVVPSEADIEKLLKDIAGFRSRLEKYGDLLSPEARQSTLKPPEGSEATSKLIAKLLTAHKVSLPGIDPADIEADRLLAERLAPVATELGSLQRLVQDTILQANHERWSATTAGYTSLVRTMDANPELREALKPALDAFGVGRKRSPRKGSGGSGGSGG
jgi:hypothetical protein